MARRAREVPLKVSEEQFTALFELSLDLLCIAGFDGYFKNINSAWSRTLGHTTEELLSKPYMDFVHPQDRRATIRVAQGIAGGTGVICFENRYLAKDGSYRWLEWSASPQPNQQLIYAAARDVTERKRTQELLNAAEVQKKHGELIENASYGIFRSNLEGRFLFVNAALGEMLGYDSKEEVLALNIAADVYQDARQRAEILAEAARLGRALPKEVTWKRKDGRCIVVHLSGCARFNSSGAFDGFEAIAENVTERRHLEQQLQQFEKMESIGRLAGGIAHDFNNLMNVVLGQSSLMLEAMPSSDPLRRRLLAVQEAGERAVALTQQLLIFSRKKAPEQRVVNLNEVVCDMQRLLQRLIGEDVELRIVLDPALGRTRVDPGQIGQVLMNLAVNAREAMPLGGKLTLETHNAYLDESYVRMHMPAQPGPHVMLAVSDTGTGIPPEVQAKIFEPFFTTKSSGTGLGLSTVYGIVKQSSGNIWVYSEPQRGTTFKIYFPQVQDAAEAPAIAPRREEMPRGSETILLVEDVEALRELAREFLTGAGYSVLEAPNGVEALRVAAAHGGEIHLLLTDVVMPEMGGRLLAKELRKTNPRLGVVFVSGYTSDVLAQQGALEPHSAFIVKPFTRSMLLSKVRELLDSRP